MGEDHKTGSWLIECWGLGPPPPCAQWYLTTSALREPHRQGNRAPKACHLAIS
jgi:hypothetical protein